MTFRGLLSLIAAIGILASASNAFAQSSECNRYRAELSRLEQWGRGNASPAAGRLRQELARMQDYYRSIGCERRGFFFSSPPPEECPAIAQRIRNMAANLERLDADGPSRSELEARRQQLIQAINQSCSTGDNRNFFERLFGAPQQQQQMMDPDGSIIEDDTPRLGGRKTACVRMCDGYNFPLATSGNASADDMCQALCPGAETRAFSMPASDDGLLRAVTVSGSTPYTSIAGAFRFQKNIDPSCYCKTDEQKWADVLKRAEQLLDRHDTIVTEERAAELSRAPAQKQKQAALAKKIEQAETEESQTAAKEGEAAPTAGRESAGIGPQSIESGRIVGRNEGTRYEGMASDGSKRTIRVIRPSSAPSILTDDSD